MCCVVKAVSGSSISMMSLYWVLSSMDTRGWFLSLCGQGFGGGITVTNIH